MFSEIEQSELKMLGNVLKVSKQLDETVSLINSLNEQLNEFYGSIREDFNVRGRKE